MSAKRTTLNYNDSERDEIIQTYIDEIARFTGEPESSVTKALLYEAIQARQGQKVVPMVAVQIAPKPVEVKRDLNQTITPTEHLDDDPEGIFPEDF